MLFFIGAGTVVGCVITGYVMHHGILGVLWQPNEIVIIGGAALGAFIIANPKDIIKDVGSYLKTLLKGKPYTKTDYIELLSFIFTMFKLIKTKG
jgi:chemotaxis protein MotA